VREALVGNLAAFQGAGELDVGHIDTIPYYPESFNVVTSRHAAPWPHSRNPGKANSGQKTAGPSGPGSQLAQWRDFG
jgi:hypothetical protein